MYVFHTLISSKNLFGFKYHQTAYRYRKKPVNAKMFFLCLLCTFIYFIKLFNILAWFGEYPTSHNFRNLLQNKVLFLCGSVQIFNFLKQTMQINHTIYKFSGKPFILPLFIFPWCHIPENLKTHIKCIFKIYWVMPLLKKYSNCM